MQHSSGKATEGLCTAANIIWERWCPSAPEALVAASLRHAAYLPAQHWAPLPAPASSPMEVRDRHCMNSRNGD